MGIEQLTLNTPTLHEECIQVGQVNFFYGKNGTGKSSAALAIRDLAGDIPVMIYNEEYINRNVQSYGRIPGVYSISSQNVEIRQKIDRMEEELERLSRQKEETRAKLEEAKRRIRDEEESNSRALWRATAVTRTQYPKAVAEFEEDVDGFAAELMRYEPKEDTDQLIRYDYLSGYEARIPKYVYFKTVPSDIFPTCDLMDIPIINRSDSALAVFFMELGNLEWARSGHKQYGHLKQCPYCSQVLPPDFEERFTASIDERYARQMETLTTFAEEYEKAATQVKAILDENRQNTFRSHPKPQYPDLADAVLEKIEGNLAKIQMKLATPRIEVRLEKIDLEKLNREVITLNGVIKRHSDSLKDIPKTRERCHDMIWQSMAFSCQEILKLREEMEERGREEQESLERECRRIENAVAALEQEIEEHKASLTDTSAVMKAINNTLSENGFTGFYLHEKADEKNAYELIRNGQAGPAHGLSEGERKFVAFLYFYHSVIDTLQPDEKGTPKIVVIDDPVCSMDSEVMSYAASLVRDMIRRCITPVRPDEACSCILQMFCFTHNPAFFRWISDPCIPDGKHCFFFLISKNRENRSSIRRCLKGENQAGRELVNFSPAVEEYQAMWTGYLETENVQELLAISKCLLFHYFIGICNYDGKEVSRTLLIDHQEAFMQANENGQSAYNIVSSLLSLIEMQTSGPVTGVYFDPGAVDADRIRFVMKRIFEIMGQDQHYKRMTHLQFQIA